MLGFYVQEEQSLDDDLDYEELNSPLETVESASPIPAFSTGKEQTGQMASRSGASVRFASTVAVHPGASDGAKLYIAVMDAGSLVVRPGEKVYSKNKKLGQNNATSFRSYK